MIKGENKILQAFLGTLLTWGLTAAGAGLVFVFSSGRFSGKRKILDFSLGFAAGVMTAASFWSLLAPAIEMAEFSKTYGDDGQYAFAPCAIGFALGGIFVFLSDLCIPHISGGDPSIALAMINKKDDNDKSNEDETEEIINSKTESAIENVEPMLEQEPETTDISVSDYVGLKVKHRRKGSCTSQTSQLVVEYSIESDKKEKEEARKAQKFKSWKRMLLLIIAITVHNIPEGLAVGVAFGAIGSSKQATFASARNLAIGIGIQNFPEGMAVSIPLCAAGYTPLRSFWYGQLSGLVEPIFGVLGALVVVVAAPLLPYALSFAAGAMIYVVVDDIIPEANMCGNGRIASWGCMIGFLVMMCLDVGLGKI